MLANSVFRLFSACRFCSADHREDGSFSRKAIISQEKEFLKRRILYNEWTERRELK